MWLGGMLLLLGTVGVLATAQDRAGDPARRSARCSWSWRCSRPPAGLFAGWLKGVVMLALTPLFAVLGGSLMLELSVPVLRALAADPGQIDAARGDGVLHDRRGARAR